MYTKWLWVAHTGIPVCTSTVEFYYTIVENANLSMVTERSTVAGERSFGSDVYACHLDYSDGFTYVYV